MSAEFSRARERELLAQSQEKVLTLVDKLLALTTEADLLHACRTLVSAAVGTDVPLALLALEHSRVRVVM